MAPTVHSIVYFVSNVLCLYLGEATSKIVYGLT